MRLTGKLVFITILLSISSLACGIYAKEAPLLLEPKFEETTTETGTELKFSDKTGLNEAYGPESDEEFSTGSVFNPAGLLRYLYNDGNAYAILKNACHSVPRYLLYCSLKLNFC